MSIVKAAHELRRIAAQSRTLGKIKVVIHFDEEKDRDSFERSILCELQSNSKIAEKHFTTLKDLRVYDIAFNFVTSPVLVFGGDD